jgi:hypothetical protein
VPSGACPATVSGNSATTSASPVEHLLRGHGRPVADAADRRAEVRRQQTDGQPAAAGQPASSRRLQWIVSHPSSVGTATTSTMAPLRSTVTGSGTPTASPNS